MALHKVFASHQCDWMSNKACVSNTNTFRMCRDDGKYIMTAEAGPYLVYTQQKLLTTKYDVKKYLIYFIHLKQRIVVSYYNSSISKYCDIQIFIMFVHFRREAN